MIEFYVNVIVCLVKIGISLLLLLEQQVVAFYVAQCLSVVASCFEEGLFCACEQLAFRGVMFGLYNGAYVKCFLVSCSSMLLRAEVDSW